MVFTHRLNELLGAHRKSLHSLSELVDMVQKAAGIFIDRIGGTFTVQWGTQVNRGWVDSSRSYRITHLGIRAHSFDVHLWMFH